MRYKYLTKRGALNEAQAEARQPTTTGQPPDVMRLVSGSMAPSILEMWPDSVVRELQIMPLAFDGETLAIAASNAEDIGKADTLRFILNKNVRLVAAPPTLIAQAINRNYGKAETES